MPPLKLRDHFAEWSVITPNGKTWKVNFYDEVTIDDRNIDTELADHPAKFALWATMHSDAKDAIAFIKLKMDRLEGDLFEEYKHGGEGEKKPTDKEVAARISQNRKYRELEDDKLKWEKVVDRLQSARDAMTHRRDMLVALATNIRRQMDVDLARKAGTIARAEVEREQDRHAVQQRRERR
jgi:hypothetical protein